MNKENNIKLTTYEKIEYDINMKIYMEHNDRIASINEHLGDFYGYKDLEDAISLEEYEEHKEYKKALKEKCEVIDKAIEYINTSIKPLDTKILNNNEIDTLLEILENENI